jgi:uncharacterized protein (DUF433 family)
MAAATAEHNSSIFDRITFEPGKMGGRACIRGMRVTVGLVVSLVAEGLAWDEILADYPTSNAKISSKRCPTPLGWCVKK